MGDKVIFRARRKRNDKVKTYEQTVVNAVILVVVLVLFLYVTIQLFSSASSQVSTQRTQLFTDVTYYHLEGVIFKDSETLSSSGDIVRYLAANGEKIGVGQAYAEVYSDVAIPENERTATEQRLNKLSDRIKMLEKGLEGGKKVSDLGAISDNIADSYYTYIDAVLGGDLSSADRSGDLLLGSLVDYSSVTLSEAVKNTLAELKAERDALISSIGGTKTTLISDKSFTFNREADGYEEVLRSSKLSGLSRESLDSLISSSPEPTDNYIGSIALSSKWFLAVPTDTAGYVTFSNSIGSVYEIEFSGSRQISISMTLEDTVADQDNSENSYLLFSSYDLLKIEGLERHQNVRVRMKSISGYRIPADAIHTNNGDTGVYILVGNMIEFRRVTPIGEGEGYYIVNTYEKDLEDGNSQTPYLGINDLIITSGRDLYDGKLLD